MRLAKALLSAMVEIMKSERSERYEAPLPPPNMSAMGGPGGGNGNGPANGNNGMFHHHHHHHPFNNGASHHPNSLPRPMPPPIPSNGMNGAGAGGGGNGGLHHHSSHHNSPLSRGNHHGQSQVNGTGPAGPSPLVGSTSTTANSAVNGVTVLNGQTPYESDPDNEKWWWVCCLEFCFCLL